MATSLNNVGLSGITVSPSVVYPGDILNLSFTLKNLLGCKMKTLMFEIRAESPTWAVQKQYHCVAMAEKTVNMANNATQKYTLKVQLPRWNETAGDVALPRSVQLYLEIDSTYVEDGEAYGCYDTKDIAVAIDRHYNPQVSTLAIERQTDGQPDDEGTELSAQIGLSVNASADLPALTAKLYYASGTPPTTASPCVDLTASIPEMLEAPVTFPLEGTFTNGADWHFLLRFGDAVEVTESAISVARSFANVHMSGASTGGVAFGKFSSSTEGNPLFECEYPARFKGATFTSATMDSAKVTGTLTPTGGIAKGAVEVKQITSIGSNFKLYNSGVYPELYRFGNVVYLTGMLSPAKTLTMTGTGNQYKMFTIPSGYRPPREIDVVCHASSINTWMMRIETGGAVYFERHAGVDGYVAPVAGNWLPFAVTWVTK